MRRAKYPAWGPRIVDILTMTTLKRWALNHQSEHWREAYIWAFLYMRGWAPPPVCHDSWSSEDWLAYSDPEKGNTNA